MKLPTQSEEMRSAVRDARRTIAPVSILSFLVALHPLTIGMFLLLVVDVAMPGRSGSTLLGLGLFMLMMLGFNAVFRSLRQRLMMNAAEFIVSHIAPRLEEATGRLGEKAHNPSGEGHQSGRDLDAILHLFASGSAATAIDILAIPVLLVFVTILHWWLGLALAVTAIVMLVILSRAMAFLPTPLREMVPLYARRHSLIEARNNTAPVIRSLGMSSRIIAAWSTVNSAIRRRVFQAQGRQERILLEAQALQTIGYLLVGILAAWLSITGHASGGVLIASVVVTLLALRPIVETVRNAQVIINARQAWTRIDTILSSVHPQSVSIALPAPVARLEVEGIAVAPAGQKRPTVFNINFALAAGDILVVLGPAGAGKSILLAGLVGAQPLVSGKVRLDGAALDQWDTDQLGAHIGYLPQGIDLMPGSVAENIARFHGEATAEEIVAAATAANAHDSFVRLPEGYNTPGRHLSLSQAQRLGLSRALFRNPFLLVFDEPTAHADKAAEQDFILAVEQAKARGAIVVLAGNARALLEIATHVLFIRDGTATDFGGKQAVLDRIAGRRRIQENPAPDPASAPEDANGTIEQTDSK
ncbi:ATP-binding cassette domain-containing protein [Sphingobium sufflavum]|uniref:ATP-binding cassette domain-containing protein n=1 Tax=Sphingobium sufflavum TaxID=1129547 RepID=UPI001F3E4F74|nr:ATP-binding cassette domain-containing protein [Sphingobium sufflavum]MCE7798510.1 ATP-binding cassette domain-containing protein [Sphingobium sufflavum]